LRYFTEHGINCKEHVDIFNTDMNNEKAAGKYKHKKIGRPAT
jgi:hypothetical protein